MFETHQLLQGGADTAASPGWTVPELDALRAELAVGLPTERDGGDALAMVEAIEALKATLAAAEIRLIADYAAAEVPRVEEERQGRPLPAGLPVVGAQVGLARRESPVRGRAWVVASRALVEDLPQTLAALERGEISEERAFLVVRESEHLAAQDRRQLDHDLAGAAGAPGLAGLGLRQLRDLVQRLAFCLDEESATRRMERARARRHVSGRMLGDGTGRITAVVKAEHYGAVLAALREASRTRGAAGDPRTPDQVRADVLVERVTGVDTATPSRVHLDLVLGVESLLGDSSEPGHLAGYGFLPAAFCRRLFAAATAADLASVRRLFVRSADRQLVAMESSSRTFVGLLARMLHLRDGGTCRTPWCDAPIRHLDHAVSSADGGATSLDNGQGLCETCNQVKETPGWTTWTGRTRDGTHEVGTLTPAAHVHTSRPPPMPGGPLRPRGSSRPSEAAPGCVGG